MARYDVIVIGAGMAGLTTTALLAKEGKRVLLLDRDPWLGGRAMATNDEGYRINLGAHLLEDSGSGLTKVFEHVGKELVHGKVSTDLPIWDNGRKAWGSIRDRYATDKTELKKVIEALKNTSYEELERWDDRPLREWLLQHTSDPGVVDLYEFIAVLECVTENWWDHSASDNLFVRKWHYEEKHIAAYSFWPGQGWDGVNNDLADAIRENGGEIRLSTPVEQVVIENGEVKGVAIARQPRMIPTEIFEEEVIEAPVVVSTLPVWNVLRIVDEHKLPEWYVDVIKFLAQDKNRIAWVGLYIATDDPVAVIDRGELATWLDTPHVEGAGFMYEQTVMDPEGAPPGKYLYAMGKAIPGSRGRDRAFVREQFERFERSIVEMWPGFKNPVWRRRHLVFDPSFGVAQKPHLVGKYRPHWRAPRVEGLYFASETFRSRGVGTDRAARAGVTVAEEILGRRIPTFGDGWRY